MAGHSGTITTDHETIRHWVEERGGHPARVKGTGARGEPGMIRIDFPGFSGEGSLQEISWDEWFRAFDDNGLAFLHQDETASGERSNFNKLIGRETAEARAEGKSGASVHHPEGKRKSTSGSRTTTRSHETEHARAASGTRSGSKASGASRSSSAGRSGRSSESSRSTSRAAGTASRGGSRATPSRSASPRAGSSRSASSRPESSRSESSRSASPRSASKKGGSSRSSKQR